MKPLADDLKTLRGAIRGRDHEGASKALAAFETSGFVALSSRRNRDEAAETCDALRHAQVLASREGMKAISAAAATLASLTATGQRFADLHPRGKLLSRRPFRKCLEAMASRGGEADPTAIEEAAGGKTEADRIADILDAAGLAERTGTDLRLTEEGLDATASRRGNEVPDQPQIHDKFR